MMLGKDYMLAIVIVNYEGRCVCRSRPGAAQCQCECASVRVCVSASVRCASSVFPDSTGSSLSQQNVCAVFDVF